MLETVYLWCIVLASALESTWRLLLLRKNTEKHESNLSNRTGNGYTVMHQYKEIFAGNRHCK
ncbi:hypothetical protein GAMM_230018 [Gammaproteobacteria bacterium]